MKNGKNLIRYNVSLLEKESILTLCEQRGYRTKKTGNNIFIYCPCHEKGLEDSSHPITNCVIGKEENTCFCYVCNKRWDVVHFVQEKEDLNFPSALYRVWESVGFDKTYIQDSSISSEEIEELNRKNKEKSKRAAVLGIKVDNAFISKNEEKSIIEAKCLFLNKRFLEIEKKFGYDYFSEEKETINKIQKEKRLN